MAELTLDMLDIETHVERTFDSRGRLIVLDVTATGRIADKVIFTVHGRRRRIDPQEFVLCLN